MSQINECAIIKQGIYVHDGQNLFLTKSGRNAMSDLTSLLMNNGIQYNKA